jgi:hypothetical protein
MGAYEDAVRTLDRTPEEMPGVLHETFSGTVSEARSMAPDTVAWIRAASGRAEHPDPRLPVIG